MKQIEKRVFHWDSGKSDEMYFRSCLWLFVQDKTEEKDYWKFLRHIVWKANGDGKTIKYLHFNEYSQRISLDYLFKEWASRVCDEMEEILRTKLKK